MTSGCSSLFFYASEEKAMLANTAGALLTDLFIVILAAVFTYIQFFVKKIKIFVVVHVMKTAVASSWCSRFAVPVFKGCTNQQWKQHAKRLKCFNWPVYQVQAQTKIIVYNDCSNYDNCKGHYIASKTHNARDVSLTIFFG